MKTLNQYKQKNLVTLFFSFLISLVLLGHFAIVAVPGIQGGHLVQGKILTSCAEGTPYIVLKKMTSDTNGIYEILITCPEQSSLGIKEGDVWSGEYSCPQGMTGLKLHITKVDKNLIEAIFAFVAPQGAQGRYMVQGTFDPATSRLKLLPFKWLSGPETYLKVGMDGEISFDKKTYQGKILDPSCGTFKVKMTP